MTRLPSLRRALAGTLLLPLLLFTGCDESVLGPTLRGTIEGRALSSHTEAPIAGASVTTSPATGAYVTDENGAFTIPDIESGPYTVSVRKEGFQTTSISVAVRDQDTTPATLFLEQSDEASRTDSLTAEIVNWSNRVAGDSSFVDVEYRVRNTGTTDISAYEVYVRIETTGDLFFQEVRGEALPSAQVDIATFSKFIRDQTAQSVTIDDLWFDASD